jgi:hypothetical protein
MQIRSVGIDLGKTTFHLIGLNPWSACRNSLQLGKQLCVDERNDCSRVQSLWLWLSSHLRIFCNQLWSHGARAATIAPFSPIETEQ